MINDIELGKRLLALKIIWIVIFISLAIYLFIGLQFIKEMQISVDDKAIVIIKPVLYVLAFITFIMTGIFRKFLLSVKKQQVQTGDNYQENIIQKYTVAVIASLALSESIGIYGLVLFFLGKNTTDLYLLILISAAAMLMYRPSKDEIISLSEASTTGGAPA